jgi:6-phosphogluconolactonase
MMRVAADPEALSREAAALFADAAQKAVSARGCFVAALSGGHTPRRAYQLLAGPPFRDQVPWDRVHVFWGDERCVPLNDPRSNAGWALKNFLSRVPIPEDQVHPLACAGDPQGAAWGYEKQLREFFGGGPPRLDLVFLGLGADGHTASLFPAHPVLKEKERWVVPVSGPGLDLHRVTLTTALFNQARLAAFLVAGPDKAWVLREVLAGPREPRRWPAQLIHPANGEVLWLVDREAAALLPEGLPGLKRSI